MIRPPLRSAGARSVRASPVRMCNAGTCVCGKFEDEVTLCEAKLCEVLRTSCAFERVRKPHNHTHTRSARLRARVNRLVQGQEDTHTARCSRGGGGGGGGGAGKVVLILTDSLCGSHFTRAHAQAVPRHRGGNQKNGREMKRWEHQVHWDTRYKGTHDTNGSKM